MVLFSLHIQMKCFPFKGGTLTDDTLVSELSERLLSVLMETFCGKTAATKSGAEEGVFASASVTVAIVGVHVPPRVLACRASMRVQTLWSFPDSVTVHWFAW